MTDDSVPEFERDVRALVETEQVARHVGEAIATEVLVEAVAQAEIPTARWQPHCRRKIDESEVWFRQIQRRVVRWRLLRVSRDDRQDDSDDRECADEAKTQSVSIHAARLSKPATIGKRLKRNERGARKRSPVRNVLRGTSLVSPDAAVPRIGHDGQQRYGASQKFDRDRHVEDHPGPTASLYPWEDSCSLKERPLEIVRNPDRPSTQPVVRHPGQRHGIVGDSRAITSVIQRIELVAATRSTVLITGETGTGKELAARALHDLSAQRDMPFVKVNCAAIPDTLLESELFGHVRGAFTGAVTARRGKFARAHRGSIFLDEIGTMNAALQAKLLRVLQEREVEPLGADRPEPIDVRVIAATNRNLAQMVEAGLFLEDLYYRLYVIPIELPPLRDRPEDIPLLAAHFVAKHAARTGRSIAGVDELAMAALVRYGWPGNIRELENTIERAVILSTGIWITRDAIVLGATRARAATVPSLNLRQNVEWIERETVGRALELSAVKREAARALGITPRALAYYLNKYPSLKSQSRLLPRPISEPAGELCDDPSLALQAAK